MSSYDSINVGIKGQVKPVGTGEIVMAESVAAEECCRD